MFLLLLPLLVLEFLLMLLQLLFQYNLKPLIYLLFFLNLFQYVNLSLNYLPLHLIVLEHLDSFEYFCFCLFLLILVYQLHLLRIFLLILLFGLLIFLFLLFIFLSSEYIIIRIKFPSNYVFSISDSVIFNFPAHTKKRQLTILCQLPLPYFIFIFL